MCGNVEFEIGFSGHANILSKHEKTIEITKSPGLTVRGDCIVGVGAEYACADLPPKLKEALRDPESVVRVSIRAGGKEHVVNGRGHPGLTLTHAKDIVIRKSRFTCSRTLAVQCDGASHNIPRSMVRALQDPSATGTLVISVERPDADGIPPDM